MNKKGGENMPWIRYIPNNMDSNKTSSFSQNPRVKILGGTVGYCTNTPVTINSLRMGAIAKIPVILAELELQISIDAVINLPVPALQVKNINKSIKIVECLLLQDTKTLFIKGYVRKTILYSYKPVCSYEGFYDNNRQCTVDLPFECTTSVLFNGTDPPKPVPNSLKVFEHYNQSYCTGYRSESDPSMSGEPGIHSEIRTEHYNEFPYCELVSSKIVEHDKLLSNNLEYTSSDGTSLIKNIEEKLVLLLTIKILRNCQISIPAMALS